MQVETAYKFKLEPTDEQQALLFKMAGCGRVAYNDSLNLTLHLLKAHFGIGAKKALSEHLTSLPFAERKAVKKLIPSSAAFNKMLTAWKQTEERAWLSDAFVDWMRMFVIPQECEPVYG